MTDKQEIPSIIIDPNIKPTESTGPIVIGPNLIPTSQLTETMVDKLAPKISDLDLDKAVKAIDK